MAVREFRYVGTGRLVLDDGSSIDPGQFTGPIDDTGTVAAAQITVGTLLPVPNGTFARVYGGGDGRVLPTPSSGGAAPFHTNSQPTARTWTSPMMRPWLLGQFTPQSSKVVLEFDIAHAILEAAGSWVQWKLYYGPVGAQLTPLTQQDALPTGVNVVVLGPTGGNVSHDVLKTTLTGLTPGTPVAYEVAAGLPAGAGKITAPRWPITGPVAIASSSAPAPYPDPGFLVAVKTNETPPNLKLIKSVHTAGKLEDSVIATFAQPATATAFGRIDVTPDGSRAVICNQADGAVQIYKTGLLDGSAPVLQARVPFAASATTCVDVICMSDNATAWVIGGGQYYAKLDLVAGAFVAVGGTTYFALGTGAIIQQVAASPDGQYIYTAQQGNGGFIKKVRVSDGAVVATSPAQTGTKAVAASPDGLWVFGATTGQNPNKVIKYNAADLTVAASVNISGTTHNAEAIAVFPDSRSFLVASSVGAGGSGVKQYDVSDLSNYANWSTSNPNGVATDIAITGNGTIFVPDQTNNLIGVWHGGSIYYVPDAGFYGHKSDLRVTSLA